MKNLKSIKFWLFDLDNTLYSGKTKVFEQVDKKMSQYISAKLNVDIKESVLEGNYPEVVKLLEKIVEKLDEVVEKIN